MDESKEVIPKWSDLCPDLLQSIFGRLSFTNLNRAKSVCRSWNSASRGCVRKRNQIPWLILFPRDSETNNNRCSLFVPDDKEKVYKTRDLGYDFPRSSCLATYGSWLLMFDHLRNLYILSPLTLERINLPRSRSKFPNIGKQGSIDLENKACLWIDEITKEYLVVWIMCYDMVFTKKGDDTWRDVHPSYNLGTYEQIFYNHRDHKVYTYGDCSELHVWDFFNDIPHQEGHNLNYHDVEFTVDQTYYCTFRSWIKIATTVAGKFLFVETILYNSETCQFRIYELNLLTQSWVKIDSLGDEALVLDIGFTVVAKDIPGIKKNSIYFSGHRQEVPVDKDPRLIIVYDLTTQTMERLPECVFSSMLFSDFRWFLPGFTC